MCTTAYGLTLSESDLVEHSQQARRVHRRRSGGLFLRFILHDCGRPACALGCGCRQSTAGAQTTEQPHPCLYMNVDNSTVAADAGEPSPRKNSLRPRTLIPDKPWVPGG